MSRKRLTDSIDLRSSTAPAWAVGAVCYQIFPDRFCNGNPENDVKNGEYLYGLELEEGRIPIEHADWDSQVQNLDVGRFYGGDLQGILDRLPYLQYLGIEVLYLNPVFESPSNHKYDCSSYELVDPHLTTGDASTSNAWFAEFVAACHASGIRVILDGVFNHCSSSHPFFREAMSDENSPYRNWFSFDESGTPEYWWGVKTLPKWNYEGAPALEDYMMDVAARWVSPPYNCDGWRLDVAADLGHSPKYNHHFWQRFRETVRKANPGGLVLAEQYEDPSLWIRNREWDTVMNYRGFMDPVSYYLTGMEKHSYYREERLYANPKAFEESAERSIRELGSVEAVFTAMNQLDNHDHSRMITRTGMRVGKLAENGAEAASNGINKGLYKCAACLLFTYPGMPALYYGDEIALPGWTDPDSRRSFPREEEDREMISVFAGLVRLHQEPVLRCGALETVSVRVHTDSMKEIPGMRYEENQEEEDCQILAFLRILGNDILLVLINPTAKEVTVDAELEMQHAAAARVLYTTETTTSFGEKAARPLKKGSLVSRIQRYSAKVYRIWETK